MHIAYEQASLYSSHASTTMTSFEDQGHINYSPDGTPQSVSGYYFDLGGHLVFYNNMSPELWLTTDDYNTMVYQDAESAEAAAYDDMVTNCGF